MHCQGKSREQKKSLCVDTLTPSLSTKEQLWPRFNLQSMVGNPTFLLWLRRRSVAPSVSSSRVPMQFPSPYCLHQASGSVYMSFQPSYGV